ncbi:MAG: response regulator [Candidatus Omnitrophota bacterium]
MKEKVLVADDERQCCLILKEYLDKLHCSVDLAFDGKEAKHLLERNKYDCVFLDCNMPELTGVELVKVIKETNPQATIAMISGYDLINEEFTKDLGINIFLKKPFSLKDIEKIIKDA